MVGLMSATFVLALTLGIPAPQSTTLAVPKFTIEPSDLTLAGDVRPRQYLGVVGREAAWLGMETGEAELWVHPIKLAKDFQLDFRIPDYVEPVRGRDVARTIEVRPGITTITYSHATFTVRQHILAPMHAPGLLVLLDVDTFRPLEIIVSFRTVFQYAWPGSFGGQYTFWNDAERVFVLSESQRRRNGVIGSPWATSASSHPAHALADAPNTFTIAVDSVRAPDEFIPIGIAAGIASRDSILATYRRLIANAHELYRERRVHFERLLASTTSIDTPDDDLDLALEWAKINLDEQMVCNPDLGCGLVAGWGTSGISTRPGFGWFFGGDAAINTFAMDATAQWDAVAQGLRFLAKYQRDDGKITHEISQSAAHIPWFTEFPYAFFHADTTPYWIVAVWRYWLASGDDELVRELWPAIRRAYAWCLTTETDGDGIIENTTGGAGAIEVGAIGDAIHQDIYLAGVWIQALTAMEDLAGFVDDADLAGDARTRHARAARTLNDAYWRESDQHHAFGILRSGRTNDNLTVWPATAAAFGLLDSARAVATLRKLATDSISADWGARMLSTGSDLYDPVHYNMGAVWPFVTGFVAWGQYNYRRPWAGYHLVDAVKQMTFDWARGRHPELLSGRYYRPLDQAVPHQFFATSMLVSPIVLGVIGWEPDAPRQRARLAPQLPPQWERAAARHLRVGATAVDAAFEQEAGRFTATITASGPPVSLDLVVPIPAGARNARSTTPATLANERAYVVTVSPGGEATRVVVEWDGGLQVEPPTMDLDPGQSSTGIRVVDFRDAGDRWLLTAEGEGGRTYAVRVWGVQVGHVTGGTVTDRYGAMTQLSVEMPPGTGRTTRAVEIRARVQR